ncbi:MAG: hypothetical protein LBT16_12605 [Treponema sp.]|jgi:hypothetical protein|nr:hypothetical protein [Treponema sp.]
MKNKNTIEDDLDAIRDQIYEEIKDMSPAEEVEYFNRETAEAIKKYGLRVAKSAQETVFAERNL